MTAREYFKLKTGGLTKPTDFFPASTAILLLEEYGKLQYNEAIDDAIFNAGIEYEPLDSKHTSVRIKTELIINLKKK
jgi:hypothetical protein